MSSASGYHPSLSDPDAWVPYRYHPSKVAAIVCVVAFACTTILHSFQLLKKKTWYFIPLIVGGIFEIIGFTGRVLADNDIWALGPFIMQSLLILLAPALFAASVYIILGRIILLVDGEQYSLIPQRHLTKIFVTGDVISFLTQCCGGGIQAAGSLSLLHAGEKIIIVGLFLQIAFFGFFIVLASLFHIRVSKVHPKSSSNTVRRDSKSRFLYSHRRLHSGPCDRSSAADIHQLPWQRHMFALYIVSALIMVRSIFRIIEYLQGNNGYLLRHEVFLYIFDALLMFMVMVLFNWVHPSEITDYYQNRLFASPTCEPLNELRGKYLGKTDDGTNDN